MTTNPPRRRNTNRLQGHDYSQEGAYFVTICTHNRECLFGNVVDEEMHLNKIGKIIQTEWIKSAQIRKEIVLGEFVVMPNHMHGIVWIVNPSVGMAGNNDFEFNHDVGAYALHRACIELSRDACRDGHTPLRQTGIHSNNGNAPSHRNSGNQNIGKFQSPSRTLGAMIRGFKSASTKKINEIRNTPRVPVFQRGFHDHIIRDEPDYQRRYYYILANPIKWKNDKYFQI